MRVLKTLQPKLRELLSGREAQDLVEYGLAVSLIALALISGMSNVATALVNAYTNISTTLTPTPPPSGGHDSDHIEPGPLYGVPGFMPTPSGTVLAMLEPSSPGHALTAVS